MLYWGGHGLCLWCQRLEAGRYHFPDAPADAASVELTAGQFQMILDGIDLSRVRRFKRFSPVPTRQARYPAAEAGLNPAWTPPPSPPTPRCPTTCRRLQALVRQLLAEVARLRAENAELQGKLDAALKHRFGRRSERRPNAASRSRRQAGRRDATTTAAPPCPSTSNAARSSTT